MKQDVDSLVRRLIAWSGGDPTQAQVPRGRRRLRIDVQRVGDVHLITVAPMRRGSPMPEALTLPPYDAAAPTVILQGIVTRLPGTEALWLALEGAGALPLSGLDADVTAILQGFVHRRVVVRGVCTLQGIGVHAIQAVAEA